MCHVCEGLSRSKSVEMDVKGIEMTQTCGKNDNKIILLTGDVLRYELFRSSKCFSPTHMRPQLVECG